MRKQAGFTLIELLVGMLVTMLIMGALVSLFSNTVQSEMSGVKQQEVYAQARAVINDLKTTLRYADGAAIFYDTNDDKISSPTYDNTKIASKVKYTATIYDSSTATDKAVSMTVEWKDSAKKQIKITKEIDSSLSISYFPNNTDNSVFSGNGNDFPIYINADDSALYHINLPYKYKFAMSGDKTDALITDVLKGAESSASADVPPILLTAGNLTFGSANAKIRTDDTVTFVINASNVNNYNNGSLNSSKSFDVLTNNQALKNQSGSITIVDTYNGMDLDKTIKTYKRSDKYSFGYDASASRIDLNSYPLTFTENQVIQANNVSWGSATGTVLNIYGTNAVYAQNAVSIGNSGKKNSVNFSLKNGETKGAIVIYSKSQVNLYNLTVPKEIAVLIYAGSGLNIVNCEFNNCLVIMTGGNCTVSDSTIYGMLETSGSNLQIEGKCTFGSFKADPTAIEVFDDYFGYNG